MVSNASARTIITPADDRILDRWHSFFKTSDKYPADKKSLYAMGKLTQVALVNYMKLRGVYADDLFVKRRYEAFTFFTLNTSKEEGVKLNEIVRSAGTFINITALKALRFQLFHNSEKPHEIGEELYFLFYYGNKPRIELDFGMEDKLELDMSDCSFETFLNCFGSIIGKINAYCAHLNPLPACEKRFRTSFCKRIPPGFSTGPFNAVSGSPEYAPEMYAKDVGAAILPGVATAAILRTCYSTDEIDNAINENVETMVQSEVNDIMGRGENEAFLEVPRRGQRSDELPYQNTLDDRSILGSIIAPNQYPIDDVPVRDEVAPMLDEHPVVEPHESPVHTSQSIVSFEVVMSPFAPRPLDDDAESSHNKSSSSEEEQEKKSPKKPKVTKKEATKPKGKKADPVKKAPTETRKKDSSTKRKTPTPAPVNDRPKRNRRAVDYGQLFN